LIRDLPQLSKRERQIMDVVYRLGRASAAQVRDGLPDAPTYTTVRGLLRILEQKGHLRHEEENGKFIYSPLQSRKTAGASILSHIVRTFFDGSPSNAMAAMLGGAGGSINQAELDRLSKLVRAQRRKSAKKSK
jgi:BlaI family penicillinase repressor